MEKLSRNINKINKAEIKYGSIGANDNSSRLGMHERTRNFITGPFVIVELIAIARSARPEMAAVDDVWDLAKNHSPIVPTIMPHIRDHIMLVGAEYGGSL